MPLLHRRHRVRGRVLGTALRRRGRVEGALGKCDPFHRGTAGVRRLVGQHGHHGDALDRQSVVLGGGEDGVLHVGRVAVPTQCHLPKEHM